ncbi:MAG: glucuronate isomerase [Tyzzerella sp.]|nr:glucuronate isomerase [Tyzzerella sp.]
MKEDFLLNSEVAKHLYHDVAAKLPIIDYHNHLSVADIASDRKFDNITQLWVSVDPYKHRAMRILGIPEKYITGDASDYEKFEKWYGCLPRLAGNPLFDWSMMEFDTVFGMEIYPFTRNAKEVWDEVNEKVRNLSATKILDKFNIEYSAPCASLIEDLSNFDKSKGICPSLRGDDIVGVNKSFVEKLEQVTNMPIQSLADFECAIEKRLEAFVETGCKYSDHALDDGFDYVADDEKNEERFVKVLQGIELSEQDKLQLSSRVLKTLAGLYSKNGFTMQLHIGAKRSTSTRLRKVAGPAGGYAAIGHPVNVKALTSLLDDIEKQEYGLPKTLLFTLNPADNAVMSILSGSYSKDGVAAIVSQGPAWWWCDHYQGMTEMLDHLSVFGVASTFIGMTTDSRSLLSFVRHDYFRRILCNWIGEKVEKGILPEDMEILSEMIRNMCYHNAERTVKGEK